MTARPLPTNHQRRVEADRAHRQRKQPLDLWAEVEDTLQELGQEPGPHPRDRPDAGPTDTAADRAASRAVDPSREE
jgi:hypothetical protein